MKSINISLPDAMRSYVEEQVAQGGYSTVSEYFRELIRLDQKRKAQERLETLLLEGLESGEATEITATDWEDIRQAVRSRLARPSQANGQD
ncbi:MAG TPA: type II toxin-antitoxin system ParD family antitoxin [Cyanobacteria bacterium UBA8553]|nr:type II toxin-antitoxin system ParD family antitoxin [Cyanobacteria bacterium UBA8553]HAJ62172.1 type II toxin-antitoxin system ParD family antitoxin [Cyanobacteria bacterium UBA8543]